MRAGTGFVGIALIIFGIAVFAYQGFSYTKQEKIAQIGNIQVTSDVQKTVYFSPLAGGVSLLAGVLLIVMARRK
jgi:hypothetical protein